MADLPKYLFFLILSGHATCSLAGQSATVTVSFTVYVPPAEEARSEPSGDEEDPRCDELLVGSDSPDVNLCHDRLTVYTWRERDSGRLLTISPI